MWSWWDEVTDLYWFPVRRSPNWYTVYSLQIIKHDDAGYERLSINWHFVKWEYWVPMRTPVSTSSSSTEVDSLWGFNPTILPITEKCALRGCRRRRQYEYGCDWDRCCKKCFNTHGEEHEPWCDAENDPILRIPGSQLQMHIF